MSRPQLHTRVYPAIAPEALGQANKGKVAVVTGAARGKNRLSSPLHPLRSLFSSLAKSRSRRLIFYFQVLAKRLHWHSQNRGLTSRCWTWMRHARVRQGTLVESSAWMFEPTLAMSSMKRRVLTHSARLNKTSVLSSECSSEVGLKVRVNNSFSILVNNVGGSTRRPMAMETFQQFWSGVEWNLKAVRTTRPLLYTIYNPVVLLLTSFTRAGHTVHLSSASRHDTTASRMYHQHRFASWHAPNAILWLLLHRQGCFDSDSVMSPKGVGNGWTW